MGGEPVLPQAFDRGQPFLRRTREPILRVARLRFQGETAYDFFHDGLIVALSYMAM